MSKVGSILGSSFFFGFKKKDLWCLLVCESVRKERMRGSFSDWITRPRQILGLFAITLAVAALSASHKLHRCHQSKGLNRQLGVSSLRLPPRLHPRPIRHSSPIRPGTVELIAVDFHAPFVKWFLKGIFNSCVP